MGSGGEEGGEEREGKEAAASGSDSDGIPDPEPRGAEAKFKKDNTLGQSNISAK